MSEKKNESGVSSKLGPLPDAAFENDGAYTKPGTQYSPETIKAMREDVAKNAPKKQ